MGRSEPLANLLRGIFLFGLIAASVVYADGNCRKGCPQSDSGGLLQYTPGNIYEYSFDSILTIGLSSGVVSEADDTSLKVVGNAKVFAEGNCGYTLQLNGVKVTNTKESVEKKIVNSIQKPVHFTLVNGKLIPEICTDESDAEYSLNIKRAIISLLQTSIASDTEIEVDVFGQCPTHTSSSKVGTADVITKVRNLNGCAYREQINSGLVTGVVNEKAGITSTFLLQADYVKESKIEQGVIENVQLVESYKFAGTAAKHNSDVHAKVVTSLKVKNPAGSAAAAPATGDQSASIIFKKPETYTAKNIAALKSALSELVDLTGDYVKKDSAKKFVELIRLLRNADTDSLIDLGASPHPNKVLARKVYLDALFRTNTAESAKAILKQLNKLDEKEKTIAILSLNLVETVDKETLTLASNLLAPNAAKELYLSVGNLISKYCQRDGCEQGDIEAISKKFADNLKHCKANTKKDEERIIYILKGIGNTGHLANSVAAVLTECAATGRQIRIRVAALQAFAAVSCNPTLQGKALALLKDHNEDSELRIEAYLAAITCPNAELANEIAEIVNSENVRQVGGFIASNLKAIRDSTDATREQQRHFLGNIRVTKQFPRDIRRYSYNNEVSYKIESLGLSASSDYKLIYSQHGFLPRSARLNVTTEIFGTNFNVFEASVRQENLENVLEYYVGPKGLLNKDFEDIVKLIEVGNVDAGAGGRARRSIADDSAKVAKKYKTYGSKNAQDLNLDLSMKLFGSELTFLSLGDNIPSSLDDIIKHFSTAFDKAKKELASFDKSYVFHTLFLDTEFVYPTGVGVPLELSAQGFAANKIDLGVNVDIDAILEQNWQRAKYRLKVVPSLDVNVNLQIGFNAQLLSTGLQVVSAAHSAAGSDVTASLINDGNGFNLDIELPRDKLELLDVQANAEFFVAEQDKPLKSIALKGAKKHKANVNENCFNQLEFVGFSVCVASTSSLAEISAADSKAQALADEIHLSRPFSFSVYVTTEKKFNLKGTHVPQTSTGSQQWKLAFNTPGSKVSHDMSLALELGTKDRTYGRLTLDSPQYHYALEAGLKNDNTELVVYAQYEQNDDVKKSRIGFAKRGNEYHPVIEIQDKNGVSTNSIKGYKADGKVVVQKTGEKQSRYTFDNFKISNEQSSVVVNGWADVGPASLSTELRIAPGQQAYFVKSNLKMENNIYAAGIFINEERTPDNVYGGSVQVSIDGQAYDVTLVGKAASWALDSSTNFESKMEPTSKKLEQELKVSKANQQVASLKLKSTNEHDKLEVNAEATYEKKVASVDLKLRQNIRAPNDLALDLNLKLNKHFVDLTAKYDVNGNLNVVDGVLTTSWGSLVTVKGDLGQRYTPQDIHIDLQGNVKISEQEKPTSWSLKVIGTPEKTNSEFKLSRENSELVKFLGETQHPQDKIAAGKVNLVVKNVLNAKGEFKLPKNGKGELTAVIETQKTEPKHKVEIDSKFHVQAPKYDVEATIIFDAEKKLYVKTENVLDKSKFSTKNVAEAADKKISFEANGNVKGEWHTNGDLSGNFVLTSFDGRVVDGNIKRKITTNPKTGVTQGNMDVQINEQEPSSGKKRSVSFTGKLDRWNAKSKELSVSSQLSYTGADDKNIELNYHIKNLQKGNGKALDSGATVRGNLVNSPIDISLVVDEYNGDHAVGRVNAKYGDRLNLNVNGNYKLGDRAAPATYELQGNLQVPESSFKSLEISSHGKLQKPSTEEGGAYLVELFVDEKTGNNQFIRLNTGLKGSQQQGTYNLDVQTNTMQGPLRVNGFYQREKSGSIKDGDANGKLKYNLNVNYGDKYLKSTSDVSYAGTETATLHFTLDTSSESAKNIDVDIRSHKAAEDTYVITAQAKQADKAYGLDTKLYRSTHKKGVHIRATLPAGEPIVIAGIVEILGERKAKVTINVENLGDLDFQSTTEAAYSSIDDYHLTAKWNSKKLNLDNYNFELRGQGKSITVLLKNSQAEIFSGTGSYSLKKEKNKSIIDGQGQVTYQGKTQNSNFKLTRQLYELTADKEVGFSYTFNGNFGPKNGVSTLKVTNKDFNIKLSVCEEKKQCTNVQVQSIVTTDEQQLDSVQHALLVLIDLRELGYPYEFELQSKTTRQGLRYQYSLDSNIISNNNLKYQLIANVLPSSSKVSLKLPKREILLETKQQVPTNGLLFGHYEQSVAFYSDKLNKPNDVARIVAQADVTGVENAIINANGEIKLEHPTIRTLGVSGKLDANREQRIINAEAIFDVFRVPEQKIIASSQIRNTQAQHGFNITTSQQLRSNGLQFEFEVNGHVALNTESPSLSAGAEVHSGTSDLKLGAFLVADSKHLDVSVNALDTELLKLTGDLNRQKHVGKLNAKLQVAGLKPVEITTEVQPTVVKVSLKREGLVDANAEVKLGKEAKFDLSSTGKQLISGRVALDSVNFLQTNYKSSDEDIKQFLNLVESEVKTETELTQSKIKQRFDKLRQRLEQQTQLVKDSTPDFSRLKSNYEHTVDDIVKELESDPALVPIIKSIRSFNEKVSKIIDDVTKTAAEAYEKVHSSIVELAGKLETIVKETVLPAWEEFVLAATKLISELRVEIVKSYTEVAQHLLSVLEQYGPALKNYGKAINEALKPVQEALQEFVKVASKLLDGFVDDVKEYLAKLPTFEDIRAEISDKLQKLKLVEKLLEILNNVFDQLHILPQTPETTEFLQKAHEYLEAKLKQKQINEEQILEELFKLLVKAIRSILLAIEANSSSTAAVTGISSTDVTSWFTTIPNSVDLVAKLPALLTFRLSLINFLLNENWENVFSKDSLSSWVFFQDFKLRGHIADGHQIFTFDGQHFSYPGNCKYILAQDSVDNNFTVVAQLNNGKLKSLVLVDRDGDFAEISDTGALKLNGKAAEYPQHVGGIHAWRKFYTLNLLSEYGVGILCTTDLKVCHIDVNGFYTSKTRGLLGNGNAEPYDDYLQVDGTLATDSATLGNGYGLGKCNPVAYQPNQVEAESHNDICNEIFGLESTLALSFLSLDPKPYRKACDIAVQAAPEKEKESTACTIALAYGSALKTKNNLVLLPPRCLKCPGAAGQRDLGDEFTVKIPNKQADVVFVVDLDVTPAVLSNLVSPAITEIRESLKSRGFTDVQIGVVAFNESQLYPALLTSNNGKINYQGNVADVQLNGPKNFCDNCIAQVVSEKRVLEIYAIVERLIKHIVPQSDELAFNFALDYPFRSGAAKSIIGVRSDTLEYNNLWKFVRAHISGSVTKFDGALLHLLAPIKGLALEGVPAEKLIGFNSRLVATVDGKDNKKRTKLEFENDMGVDFVLNNGGWVFATQNFDKLKPQDQKKVLNQVTTSIADTMFKTDIVSDCRCLPVHGLHAQHKCAIKSSTFTPNKKPKAA